MIYVQVCVGSSCHLKGAPRVVELFQQRIREEKLEDEILLMGSFCTGKCNRVGVTVTVADTVYTGVTPESFETFWKEKVLSAVEAAKENA